MSSVYWECSLAHVPAELEDEIVGYCFECGCSGVSEDLAFEQPNLAYQPEVRERAHLGLIVYFEQPPLDFVESLRARWPEVRVNVSEHARRDWMAEWKKGFRTFEMVEGVWVVPSWDVPPARGLWVQVDPGMAFGTGHHGTTALCASALRQLVEKGGVQSVLDVGCGTGILGLVVEKMGVPLVEGIDNDPEAIRVAGENILLNSSRMKVSTTPLGEVRSHFDVVVANIVTGVLRVLLTDLIRLARTDLILSGILVEEAEAFADEVLVQVPGWSLVARDQKEGWVSLHLRRVVA